MKLVIPIMSCESNLQPSTDDGVTDSFQCVSWSKSESRFTDWKIEIVRTDTSTITYHVHQMVLAVGPRHSVYFSTLFDQDMRENENMTSRIELSDEESACFPFLLNYLYPPDHKEFDVFTHEQLITLYKLAEYFQIPKLCDDISKHFGENLTIENMPSFVATARQFENADLLMDAAANRCAQLLKRLSTDISTNLDPEFFLKVLVKSRQQGGAHEIENILVSMENHSFSKETFTGLMSWINTYHVTPKSALRLLKIGGQFEPDDPDKLTEIEEKCVQILAVQGRQVPIFLSREAMLEETKSLPPRVLRHLLVLQTANLMNWFSPYTSYNKPSDAGKALSWQRFH